MKKFLYSLIAIAMILTIACNNDEDKDVVVPVTGITFDESDLTVAPNVTIILKATVEPKNATNKKVTWSASGSAVTIDAETGELITKTAGTATITVTTEDGGISKSRDITVQNVPVTGIMLTDKELVLAPGMKRTLVANVLSAAATNKKVIWSSDNTTVAAIDASTGELNVRAVGEATITATTDEGGYTDECKITAEFVNLLVNPGFEEPDDNSADLQDWTKVEADWFGKFYADPGAAANLTTVNRVNTETTDNGVFLATGNGSFFQNDMSGKYACRVQGGSTSGLYQLVNVAPLAKYMFSLTIGYRETAAAQRIRQGETVKILSPDGLVAHYEKEIDVSLATGADGSKIVIVYVTGEIEIPEGITQIRFQFDQRQTIPAFPGDATRGAPLMMIDDCEFIQLTLPPE